MKASGELVHGYNGREATVVRRDETRSSVAATYYAVYATEDGKDAWYVERGGYVLAWNAAEAWGARGEVPADAERDGVLEDGRQLTAELGDMTEAERDALPVHVGDRVRDPLDGRWRAVKRVEGGTVYMTDGGCMGIDECREIRLPSETLEASEC